jgi:2-polyprenyl-3-methyl-5-hydroxy-6-metoxy-1,4-benzoquinol methylase
VVAARQVQAALPSTGLDGARRLGLIGAGDTGAGERVCARLDLRPYGDGEHDWWVVSDLGEMVTRAPLGTDHVLGVGGASTTLAAWTPRRPVRTALDLGTGCGVQALHLATHADSVTATDTSSRALRLAALTAALNRQ